jgi:hypothetical protein
LALALRLRHERHPKGGFVTKKVVRLAALCAAVLAHPVSSVASSITLNFDSVNATAGAVDATASFASFGVTVAGVTAGTQVQIMDDAIVYGGAALVPASSPNVLMQNGSNDPVSFELDFATPLTTFQFTIPGYESPSLYPAWQAYAYDGATLLDSASDVLGFFQHAGPLSYTLDGPNITRVIIASQNFHVAGFSGVPLDNLVLTAPDRTDAVATPEPASLTLLGSGLVCLARAARRRTRRTPPVSA